MKTSKQQTVVSLILLIEVAAVLVFAKQMGPIREGTSADFWRNACGVDLDGKNRNTMGGIYPPRDGWYIYYIQGFHGQFLFRVRRSAALADYGDVLQWIKQSVNEGNAAPVLRLVYKEIEQNHLQIEQDPDRLLSLL